MFVLICTFIFLIFFYVFALNDDALVASTYCLACKVVCLCV